MKNASPTLGPENWITDVDGILTRMFATFVTNNHSQSNHYDGSIISLRWILSGNQGDNVSIQNLTRNQLTAWLDRHFQSNTLDVRISDNPDGSTSTLIIDATATVDGKTYSAGRAVQFNSDTLVIELVNELR